MKGPHVALLLSFTGVWLNGCTRQESAREVDWAKAALSRNPDFEIVATDEGKGVFTVRDTATGAIRTLSLKELVAAPLPAKQEPKPVTPAPEATPSPEVPEEPTDAALADNQTTVPEAVPANGASLAAGPGYSISRGTGDNPEAAAATLEGPGYKIERHDEPRRQSAPAAEVQATNVEKRSDPIICQGNRLMRIDGETIDFTGDAVIAEQGCDLYISNARIRAGGVGVIARQQARVHIVNSTIGGTRGSYEASDGAEIYVARTTFTGIGRRFDGGTMTDLGGNSYETH